MRILYSRCLSSICCIVAMSGVALAEVQTQHAVDTSAPILWFEPLWHFRARTTPQGSGMAQVRTGPILHLELGDRVTLLMGYYFTREKEPDTWVTTHRPFAGAEFMLWNRVIEVDARSLVERFAVHRAPDYTRYRNRLRISPESKTAPYIGVEVFADVDGWRKIRYSAGIRRTFAEELIIDFGYFFEEGRRGIGSKHMIGTSIHWRNKQVRIDPDL